MQVRAVGRNMLVLLAREVVVEPRITDVDVHGNCTATGTSNHNLRLMLIEFSLGGRYSSGEIIVIECRIDDLVAVIFQVGRFDATRDRVPAVKEEDFHLLRTFSRLGFSFSAKSP